MSAFAYYSLCVIVFFCFMRREHKTLYSILSSFLFTVTDMVEETILLLSAAAAIVGHCSSGDCLRREMCADRPWVESPTSERNDDRVRVVDAPVGSDIVFLCSYCGERDKGQARFWYTSHRYLCSYTCIIR